MVVAFITSNCVCLTPLRPHFGKTNVQKWPRVRLSQGRKRVRTSASFTDDFFRGPSSPPKPRPLYQVVLFAATTNLLWYPYYKFCIEEELRRETGQGFGGYAFIGPLLIGLASPFVVSWDYASVILSGSLLWVAALQYWFYRRVNNLSYQKLGFYPLHPWWIIAPGFNFIVGFRAYHFLSTIWGAKPEEDPLVSWLPFLGVQQLSISRLLTTPSLWLRIR